jgi:hypothetical protein
MTDFTTLIFDEKDPWDLSPKVMNFSDLLNVTVPPVDTTASEFLVSATVTAVSISTFLPNDLITNGGLVITGNVVDGNGHVVGTMPSSAVLTIVSGGTAGVRYRISFTATTSWGYIYNRSGILQVAMR